MPTRKTFDRITEVLRDSGLSWLLPNLRQDLAIWNTLNDPLYFEKFVQQKPDSVSFIPDDFTPARLALLKLEQYNSLGADHKPLLGSIDNQLVQRAIRSLMNLSDYPAPSSDLAAAGLIAIALAVNFSDTNSWKGLLSVIQEKAVQFWLTPLACLYGLIENPAGLLNALVQPGVCSSRYQLAIHAILSNPIPSEGQIDILIGLFYGPYGDLLPPTDRLLLVRQLYNQRPQIAHEFCLKWLAMHPGLLLLDGSNQVISSPSADQPGKALFELEVRKIAGQSSEQAGFITEAFTDAASAYREAIVCSSTQLSRSDDLSGVCQKAAELSRLSLPVSDHTTGQAQLALVLLDHDLVDQALELLPHPGEPLPEDVIILYAIAWAALQSGDHQLSSDAAIKILDILHPENGAVELPVWGETFSLVGLGKILLNLHKSQAAAQIFELALQTCPSDADLIKLYADSLIASHIDQQAADVLHALVALNPGQLEYRRSFANVLAVLGDWDACVHEWSMILASSQAGDFIPSTDDQYAYAHSALMANQPDLTINVCSAILANKPEDYQAFIYKGKAHVLKNEIDQGIEYLARATAISPDRPEAWLALANAQQKVYPLEMVIETLKNATQTVPASSQIYFALGDRYLQDNAPTLALPELQSAMQLAPDEPSILVNFGRCSYLLGRIEDARLALAKAYILEPNFTGLAQLYAKILVDLGRLDEAVSPLETLVDSNTIDEPGLYLEYARCVLTLNKNDPANNPPMKALIALNHILQADPGHAEARALTAEALAANGENELAFQAYREALDTPLTKDQAWFERLSFGFGCVAASIGKHDIAIAALQEAAQVNPNNPAIFKSLSGIYLSANLPEDAMRSARSVLVIDGENPDHLAWFAGQAVKLVQSVQPDLEATPEPLSKQAAVEALNALYKAIQLAPTRTDLLVQLGSVQSCLGANDSAQVTYASIASHDFATIDDLQAASLFLSKNGDHASAIACLERAISLDLSSSGKHISSLYSRLAKEYVSHHDPSAAITTLDKAIELIPYDSSLILLKINILLELGQTLAAIQCIEVSLQHGMVGQSNIELLFLASRVYRTIGDFSAAVRYVRKGVTSAHKQGISDHGTELPIQYRAQTAELYRALIQPDQAFHLIQDVNPPHLADFPNEQAYLDYLCLQAELALDMGEPVNSDFQALRVEPSDQNYPRLVAINARLLNRAGNYTSAVQLLKTALDRNALTDQTIYNPGWSAAYYQYLSMVSLIEAALDLGLWDQALKCIQQIAESESGEPLLHLNLSKYFIQRAEFNHLCEIFDVTKHNPLVTNPADDFIASMQELENAKSSLQDYQDHQVFFEHSLAQDQIYRWNARANIIFRKAEGSIPDLYEMLVHQHTSSDTAALIHHLHHVALLDPDGDSFNRIIKLARTYPQDPLVVLQVAFVLQDTDPANAMKSLQSITQQKVHSVSPTLAFCNILLAKLAASLQEYPLARQAVETALSFWQDEPCWHSLAAQICEHTADVSSATNHLLEASQLAPSNIAYHKELGRLYFENADADLRMLSQARASFEKALTIDQNDVPALYRLASTQYLMNDLEKAEGNARSALVLAPNRVDIYQLLSEIAIKKYDFQGAYEYANKAISISPQDVRSTIVLVKSLTALERFHEALSRLNTVIPLVPDAKWLYMERVNILEKMKGSRVALNELVELTHSYPDDFDVLYALTKQYVTIGEVENAVSVAEQALKICNGKNSCNEQANLHLMLGQVLRQAGRLDQSMQHLSEAIQLAPDRLEPYLELGLARKERREYKQALQIFERATLIAPDDPRALFQAGLALKESKDYKSSETMLRRAVSLAPNDLNIRRQLAVVVALNLVHNPRTGRNYAK